MNKLPIGILSGTFDPIHLGHIHLAQRIKKLCHLQKVLLIPCEQSPFKAKPIASVSDRLKMIELAIKNLPALSIDTYETQKKEISYTIYTLEYLAKKHKDKPLALIMGMDVFSRFDEWLKPQEIMDLAHVLVVKRKDHEKVTNKKVEKILLKKQISYPKQLQNKRSGLIYVTNIDPLPISATKIRRSIKQQKDAGHLLNKDVWHYIKDKKLYLK